MGIDCSMSRNGCCYDNAVAERFFWSLKNEWGKHETLRNFEEARWNVFRYSDAFYNSVRIHQILDTKHPTNSKTDTQPVVLHN